MDFDFETLYNSYSKKQLYEILKNQDDYQPEAINIAKKIAKEKGWLGSINSELTILAEEANKKKQEQKKMNSIINDQCFLEINKNYIIETNSILSENDIEHYFVEKSNVKNPGRFYYFFRKDIERVKRLLGKK